MDCLISIFDGLWSGTYELGSSDDKHAVIKRINREQYYGNIIHLPCSTTYNWTTNDYNQIISFIVRSTSLITTEHCKNILLSHRTINIYISSKYSWSQYIFLCYISFKKKYFCSKKYLYVYQKCIYLFTEYICM